MRQTAPEHSRIIELPGVVVEALERVIAAGLRRHQAPLGDDELLTPEEVAKILRVPSRHARRLMADGTIQSTDIQDVGLRCTVAALRGFVKQAIEVGASR